MSACNETPALTRGGGVGVGGAGGGSRGRRRSRVWVPEALPWSLICRDGADAESSCPESRTDSWSQDGERNPWSTPTTELWAPTGSSSRRV